MIRVRLATVNNVCCTKGDLVMATSANLHSIATLQNPEEFATLISEASDENFLVIRDENGNGLTHLAALHGNIPLLRFLIENQILEVDALNKLQQPPLFFAILSGSLETVRVFLEEGASFDVADANGETPAHIAAKVNNLEIAEFVSTIGVDLNHVNNMGETALHVACRLENLNSVIALSAAGVNQNAVSGKGATALLLSAQRGFDEIVRVLLGRGANPNIPDKTGNMPLHFACANGDHQMAELLCEHGAALNVHNHELLSPLHLAAKSGGLELVRALLYHGADSIFPNGVGITADVTAYANGHTEIGKLIASISPDRFSRLRGQFEPLTNKPRIKLK
uniref:ANK_REP_REGION domain-containing protein n=2 Tax=Mesocestoides corti TaxID=53468 RepID=A0A5K3F8G2_MESCO